MKKTIIIALSFWLVGFIACQSNGNSKNDNTTEKEKTTETPTEYAEKMLEKLEIITEVSNKASEDSILDDEEIEKINSLSEDLDRFEKELNKKYQNDTKGQNEMEKFVEEYNDKIEKIYEDYYSATMSLYECKGSERLKL